MGGVSTDEVRLEAATLQDAELLSNLLELYIHDLSEAFPDIELGADGRFGYRRLPLYWSDPSNRFPFLVKYGQRVVGFALIMRGSLLIDPDAFDVAEFFILRRWRRTGLGRRAAHLLWDRLPGRWIVRAALRNAGAVPFWARTISEYIGRDADELPHPQLPDAWRVFTFQSTPM